MSLPIQKGFWNDQVIANTREKIRELYHKSPDIAQSEKLCLLEYWSQYEGLSILIADKWPIFIEWFFNTTSPETITRCLRSLKEDGTIALTPEQTEKRQERENSHRKYWGNDKRNGCQKLSERDSDA